ncbi:hypothetical protein SRB5_49840 [Streptomyces sp. RB5]|uniref:HTH cro/C1-type domain-containing protein n=1 Tax=Streptomyces smaragdinus TaxID=2585196 RepID=A0A7K0CMU7_9ACTN|nr:helix-turn-helix transcriptional regulator [Streptomyces smaragdinus]MQY14808.1 hypothetical protein [Streptomyces smaragdinus]
MPPRNSPTARQVRLGAELRKLREQAGLTAKQAGGHLAIDQAKISHLEAGRIGVGEERIRRLAAFYRCGDAALIDALCAIAREHRGQHWWDNYRGILDPAFMDIAELEHHAVALRSLQVVTVPGLLQTEAYARTIFAGGRPKVPESEFEARVEQRMKRATILDRDDPPAFEAFIHEAALRMRFGGRKVVKEQLGHLMEVSELPLISVRVIPLTCEDYIEASQSVLYASGVVPQLDTVQIDGAVGGCFLDSRSHLENYRQLLDGAEQLALDQQESRHLIHHIAREL